MGKKTFDENIVDYFKIDVIMSKLRFAISNNIIKAEDYSEVVWLIKLVLKSNEFFKSTREVNNLLSNICGFAHNTKSTGRDRIVDWYFRELEQIEPSERNETIKRIAKYTFTFIPSDYTEWKNILIGKGSQKERFC